MVKTQAALPRTRFTAPSRLDELQDLNEKMLIIKRGSLGTALIGNRINLDDYEVRNELVVVSRVTKNASKIDLPIVMFRTNNGFVGENSITSNGNADFLMFGPYATISPGLYRFTVHLSLHDSSDRKERFGFVDMVSGVSEQEHLIRALMNDEFDEDGNLTLHLELLLKETVRNFELRIYTEHGVILQVSDIHVEVQID